MQIIKQHKAGGTVMNVAKGRAVTIRTRTGMLHSRVNIGDILRNSLSSRKSRMKSPAINFVVKHDFVVYNKALLDEPELDGKLAEGSLACVWDLGPIKLCDPATIPVIRNFKAAPLNEAGLYGMMNIAKRSLSGSLPADVRFKGYEVFNHAIGVDKRNGTNAFIKVLKVSSRYISSVQKYQKFIDALWLDPRHDEQEYFQWLVDLTESSSGNHKGSGSTGYYNDKRFIGALNVFLEGNRLVKVKKVKEPVIEKHNIF